MTIMTTNLTELTIMLQVMTNSARGMQIFGTMEKGILVPDVRLMMMLMMVMVFDADADADDGDDDAFAKFFSCRCLKSTKVAD